MISTAISLTLVCIIMAISKKIPERWDFLIVFMKVITIVKMIIFGFLSGMTLIAIAGAILLVYFYQAYMNPDKVNKHMKVATQVRLQFFVFLGSLLYILYMVK